MFQMFHMFVVIVTFVCAKFCCPVINDESSACRAFVEFEEFGGHGVRTEGGGWNLEVVPRSLMFVIVGFQVRCRT